MTYLDLDYNERILFNTAHYVMLRDDIDEYEVDELYLTTRNIISIYEYSKRAFSKTETVVRKTPLQSIHTTDDKADIVKIDVPEYGYCMDITLTNGKHEQYFFEDEDKELSFWIDSVSNAVFGRNVSNTYPKSTNELKREARKAVFESKLTSLTEKYSREDVSEEQSNKNSTEKTTFCSNCGKELKNIYIFCPNCGEETSDTEDFESTEYDNTQSGNFSLNADLTNKKVPSKTASAISATENMKNKWVALLLCFFLGVFGAHKFYERKNLLGIVYLFTLGLFGIGIIVDVIVLITKPNPYYV